MMRPIRWIATLALLSCLALGADESRPIAPVVGAKSPKLRIGATFKGTDAGEFRPGTVYVVEFWATWCRPCLQQLPHVRELRRTYPNVEFVWVDVWEGDEAGVRGFVERMGDQMPFTVAIDADRDAEGIGATAKA